MSRPSHNLLGLQMGSLTVIKTVPAKQRRRGNGRLRRDATWLCKCVCGREKEVLAGNLIGGKTSSCGICVKQKSGAAFRQIFRSYGRGAKLRGYSFLLSADQMLELSQKPCFYCGCEPSNISTVAWKHGPEVMRYSGIDRRDNSLGYTIENCVPCCVICNRAKMKRDEKEFIAHCKLVASRF